MSTPETEAERLHKQLDQMIVLRNSMSSDDGASGLKALLSREQSTKRAATDALTKSEGEVGFCVFEDGTTHFACPLRCCHPTLNVLLTSLAPPPNYVTLRLFHVPLHVPLPFSLCVFCCVASFLV
jgi:hypothetical protein